MATVLMPYSIGQTSISFVEEFNITIDSGVCTGNAVISAVRSRIVLDGVTVRGITQILDAQEYSSAGFLGIVIGNAVLTSIDSGKSSQDSGSVIGVTEILFARSGYVGLCQGVADINADGGGSDSIALTADISAYGVLDLTRNLRTRNVPGEEIVEDRSTAEWQFGEILTAETLDHALFVEALIASTSQGEFYRTIGLDNRLSLTSESLLDNTRTLEEISAAFADGEIASNIQGRTAFGGAESSVAIYREIFDVGFAVGVSATAAAPQDPLTDGTAGLHPYPPVDGQTTYTFSVTIDDYWLAGVNTVDGVTTNFTPRTYVTIPKANRIAIGGAQAYNSNYEVVGFGEPNLNNTPIFTTRSSISDFSAGGNTLGGSEVYEPSFLRVDMYAGATVTHTNFTIDESGVCIGSAFISGEEALDGGEFSRYGGQGTPPGIYGPTGAVGSHGIYTKPRGSDPDDFVTASLVIVSTVGTTTTFTTLEEHRFVSGDSVAISGVGPGYDTASGWTIALTPTPTTFTVENIPGASGTFTNLVGVAKSKNYYNRVLGGYMIGRGKIGPTGAMGTGGDLSV